jgi:polysaccharide export outer membrane protein
MKKGADQMLSSAIVMTACTLSLFGQAPVNGQMNQATQPSVTAQGSEAEGSKAHDNKFVIGEDDVLSINVWKEPDLSRSIPVRSDGKISLPLAGEIQAAGRTPLQLEEDIAGKLRDFITKPEVTVMIQEVRSQKFNILGQVAKPGSYSLTLASTVMDAISIAGGFRDFAKQKSIYVLRQNASGAEYRIGFNYKDFVKGKTSNQNIKLEPHDTVVVP